MGDVGIEQRYFSRFLDITGLGTGNKNAAGDYSSGVQDFKIAPRSNKIFRIASLTVFIQDSEDIAQSGYGAVSGLTNGIRVFVTSDRNETLYLDDGEPIKTIMHWTQRSSNLNNDFSITTPRNPILLRWNFLEAGVHVRLNGFLNEALVVRLNDDFSDLTDHKFLVQGYQESKFWE